MRPSIRLNFNLAIILLLLVIVATCFCGWYFINLDQQSTQQIFLQRSLEGDLVEMLSLSAEVIFTPTPRTVRVMAEMLEQTKRTVRDNKEIFLSGEERRLILARLDSFAGFNAKLEKVITAYPASDPRVQRAKNLILIRNGEELGGCRGIVKSNLKLLEDAHLQRYSTASLVFGWSLLILTLTTLVLAIFTSRQILSPIRDLQRAMDGFSVGDKERRVERFNTSEMASLAHSFNHMADSLNGNIHRLELANQELESFAYSVSHDLRGPLRAMDGFSSALEEDCAEQLDDQARSHLQKIKSAAAKMGDLIEDILRLSRIGRAELHLRKQVDIVSICRNICAELQRNPDYPATEISLAEPITVDCDAELITIALTNLLENAHKFSSKSVSPNIKISVNNDISGKILVIDDNGDGFDPRYADQLFLPFKRLHAATEFSGTGIGLAIVKRIVDKHRGHIWAESSPGEGARFYVKFPNERRRSDR